MRVGKQLGGVAQFAGDVGADVGGLGQSTAPVGATRAQLCGARQRGDRAHAVAASQDVVGGLFEQRGDVLVGLDGRFGQVPGPALGLMRILLGQRPVDAAALVAGRQLHDSGPRQRMAERQASRALVDVHQPRSFGGSEVLDPSLPGPAARKNTEVSGAIQDRQQQQVTGRGGQAADPRREHRLEPPAERQHRGQRPGRLRAAEQCHGQLQQGQRVALRLGQQPLAHPRRQRRKTIPDQGGRGPLVERLQLIPWPAAPFEEALLS
jgi:hypothetical protein